MNQKNTIIDKHYPIKISHETDIINTEDILLDLSRKIFITHHRAEYDKLNFALFTINPCKNDMYPNIIISPHFIRDDGTIIYLQLIHNNNKIKIIPEKIVNLSMEILDMEFVSVFTIYLNNNFSIDCLNDDNIDVSTLYEKIIEKKYIHLTNNKSITNFYLDCNNSNTDFIRHEWVSASKTRNYALKDTLIDWLDLYQNRSSDNENSENRNNNSGNRNNNSIIKSSGNEYNFTKFIMNAGNKFESEVILLIKQKVKEHEFVTICKNMNNFDKNILDYEKDTIDAIHSGIPIIYQGVLMNRTGQLAYSYGLPDLIVRSDYLHKIVKVHPLDDTMKYYKAPNLEGAYHYVIVDIKFTTLNLCADGKRIRNSGSTPAYKCQLYIYNHAIGIIQGYEPSSSFILGRKYKYDSRGVIYVGSECFDRFGHIDYDQWDKYYVGASVSAINWIKKLRSNGKEWNLLPKPTISELYPNMCSQSDTPWNKFKKDYSKQIGEITLLWNCGIKNREIAHSNGVFSYWDKKCCSKTVGICGSKQAPILDKIISINKKRKFDSSMDYLSITLNKNVDNQWMNSYDLRLVVDFEIINNVFDDFSHLPHAQNSSYLFLIGVAYQIKDHPVNFKAFIASELSCNAEFQVIYQFYNFLRDLTDKHLGKDKNIPPLYHWGHIERTFFSTVCTKLAKNIGSDIKLDIQNFRNNLCWYDLLECFKENPIVINGCFKFGLKEVATRLAELDLIKTEWNSGESECSNGNTAMIMAQQVYKTALFTKIPVINSPVMKEIIDYNRIDCVVVHEIIDVLNKKVLDDSPIRNTKKQRI